jgi:hypothetical protein
MNNSIICASTNTDGPGPFANTSKAQYIDSGFPVEVEATHYVFFPIGSYWMTSKTIFFCEMKLSC